MRFLGEANSMDISYASRGPWLCNSIGRRRGPRSWECWFEFLPSHFTPCARIANVGPFESPSWIASARLPPIRHHMQPHRNCPRTIVPRTNEHARRATRNTSVVQEPPIKVKGTQSMSLRGQLRDFCIIHMDGMKEKIVNELVEAGYGVRGLQTLLLHFN